MEKINKNGRRNPNVAGVVVFLFLRFCWYSVSVDNHANIMWIACGGINRGEHLRIPHLHEPRKMSSLLFFLFFLSCTSKFNHPYTILFPFEPLEVFEITDSSTKKIHQLPFPVLGEEAILRVFFSRCYPFSFPWENAMRRLENVVSCGRQPTEPSAAKVDTWFLMRAGTSNGPFIPRWRIFSRGFPGFAARQRSTREIGASATKPPADRLRHCGREKIRPRRPRHCYAKRSFTAFPLDLINLHWDR